MLPTHARKRARHYHAQIRFTRVFKEGWRRFGTAFPVLLYMLGFEGGKHAYKDHARIAGGDAQAAVKVAEAFFQLHGYGKPEFLRIDDAWRGAVVRVYDSFEVRERLDPGS